jgi:hypothetical protein
MNIFTVGKLTDIIKNESRDAMISDESLYFFLKKLSEYSITDYKDLKIESQFSSPLIINTNEGKFERNYVEHESYKIVKENLQ